MVKILGTRGNAVSYLYLSFNYISMYVINLRCFGNIANWNFSKILTC